MKARKVLGVIGVFALGYLAGDATRHIICLKNTPEVQLSKIEMAKADLKNERSKYDISKKEYLAAYHSLVNTKAEYKKEVRDEVESQVRQELQEYISRADETYEKAKKESEYAKLALDFQKRLERGTIGNFEK